MRRRKKNRTGVGIIAFVVLILCGIVSYQRIGLEERKANAAQEIVRLNSKIEKQEERQADIKDLQKYVQTKQFVRDIAREKLGLVDKDDVIIKPEE